MFNPWKVVSIGLAAALIGVVGTGNIESAQAEQQPQMIRALGDLRQAKNALEKATHDKGGHRAKALALTNQAIDEVQKGIAFDEKH
jgi:hypothetical protein